MNNSKAPPRWMESLLERMLAAQKREEIVGDFREEYIESILPQRGQLRADLWYARHALSFLPRAMRDSRTMGKLLIFISGFTMICMFWLAAMEMKLRHPGFGSRMALDICIALLCLVTAVSRILPSPQNPKETWVRGMWFLVMLFGAMTFYNNARAPHFEGFVFVISLLLIAQGMLTVLTLDGRKSLGQPTK